MRIVFVLIVLLSATYLGYVAWTDQQNPPSAAATAPAAVAVEAPPAATTIPAPPAAPAFPAGYQSKIALPDTAPSPGEKRTAGPGEFYPLVASEAIETKNGLIRVTPGDKLLLIERLADGRIKLYLPVRAVEVVFKAGEVTNDLDAAQAAEAAYVKKFGAAK